MIEIVYYRRYHRVTVKGHANSAEYGQDLVCAAVSGITHTLAANVERLNGLGLLHTMQISLQSGDAEIGCKCKNESKIGDTVKIIFDALCLGYSEMAEEYPEYVHFEIRG